MKFLLLLSFLIYPSFFCAQTIPDSMGSAGGSLNQVKKDPAAKQAAKDTNVLREDMEDLVDATDIPRIKGASERKNQNPPPKKHP